MKTATAIATIAAAPPIAVMMLQGLTVPSSDCVLAVVAAGAGFEAAEVVAPAATAA